MRISLKKTFLFTITFLILLINDALTLEQVTHGFLNETVAQQIRLDSYLKTNLGFTEGVKEKINGKQIFKWASDGGIKEDEPINTRSFNHFHDPLKIWNSAGFKGIFKSSIVWSQDQGAFGSLFGGDWSWKKARDSFYKGLTEITKTEREKNLADTFRALGQVMHLVQDASVPAHVRNDTHVYLDLLGIKIGGFHYEIWVKNNHSLLNLNPVSFDQSILNLIPESSAPIPIANIFDTNRYTGLNPNVATGSNIGLTEFTNANFFSEGTIFKDYPHPTKENTNVKLIEQIAKDGKTDKVWYIQGYTSQRLAAYSYLWNYSNIIPKKEWLYNLDNYVYADYSAQLIPRAVGYSAGLLNYFFRGEIDMISDDATGSGYVIVNNTDEDMSGTFELWYDNKSDQRVKSWSASLSISKKSSGNNKSTNITFTPPTDAKEPDKYMLVFRGNLGNEENAVVGKEVMLLPPLVFLIYQDAQNNPVYAVWSIENDGKKLVNYNFDISKYATYFNIYNYRNPSVVKSDDAYQNHVYTIENSILGSIQPQYGKKMGDVVIGVRNSFLKSTFDFSTGYTGYSDNYICSGRNSSYIDADGREIENLELWKINPGQAQFKYKVNGVVTNGVIIPYGLYYAAISKTKYIGKDPTLQPYYNNGYSTGDCVYQTIQYPYYSYKFGNLELEKVDGETYNSVDCFVSYGECSGYHYYTHSNNWDDYKKGSLVILDYDNIVNIDVEPDDTFIALYTTSGSASDGNGTLVEGEYTQCPENYTYFQGTKSVWTLAYRLKGGSLIKKEIGNFKQGITISSSINWICEPFNLCSSNSTSSSTSVGDRIRNVSCKVSKNYLAYTYILEDANSGAFKKRILGIIDIKSGLRSEYEVDDKLLGQFKNVFDEKLISAIGFHNGSVKKEE